MAKGKANPIDAEVGRRIKLQRLGAGLSQTELGDKIGVTFQQVQKYEQGQTRVGASRLSQVAKVLNVPVSTFFDNGSATTKSRSTTNSPLDLLAQPLALKLLQLFSELPNHDLRQSVVHLVNNIKQSCYRPTTAERKPKATGRAVAISHRR